MEILETLIEETNDIIYAKDLDGRYVLVNSAMAHLFNASKQEILGKSDAELLSEAAQNIGDTDIEVLKSGQPSKFEEVLRISDKDRTFDTTKLPCRDKDGQVVGLVCVAHDITEQKLEVQLKESNERLRTVMTNAPIILFATNKEGMITVSEGRALKALGQQWDEYVGRSVYDVYDDSPQLLNAFDRALKGEQFAVTLGSDPVLETTFSPLTDDMGTVSGVIGVATDITRRQRTEEALRSSKENLAKAQRIAHIGSWVWKAAQDRLYGSDEAWRLLGLPPQEHGMDYQELIAFVDPKDREHVKKVHGEALSREKPYSIEYRVLLPGGSKRIFQEQGEATVNEGGEPTSLHATIQDVTELKSAEEIEQRKDKDIRQAYADVFCAVTQEKLIILTKKEINAALGNPDSEPFFISSFEKLADSRAYLRESLKNLVREERFSAIIMASGEAVTNGIKHAGSCQAQVYWLDEICQIMISDKGPGIDFGNLPKATLLQGFSTKNSLGMGFSIILEIFDRVLLSTDETGTTLVLEIGDHEKAEPYDRIFARINVV